MKFEKIPADNFVIKIELDAEEAKFLLRDLNAAEDEINFFENTEEFHKQLKALLE
ncbi:hypothetical protein ES703_86901 [subsurface metagenome]